MATYSYNGKNYTQEQMDTIAKKATPSQREAINKQFGTQYARAEPTFTGTPVKGAPATNTGIVPPVKSTAIPAPVKVTEVKNTPPLNYTPVEPDLSKVVYSKPNTTPANTAPVKGSFGDVAADNVHAQTFENTGVAFKENADKYADKISDIATKEGADKKKLIEESNVEKLARTKLQEEELARMKTSEKAGQEKLRSDVSKITAIQDQIASRNANASAAQAGESGLQLSQAAMDDVRNDIMAKYGQNIANAKQFELQTNTSIEAALQNIDNNIFGKQDAINTFKNALKDAEFAPVLNAVTAAAQGHKDAAKDVLDYYKKYIDMKAAEEYTSMAAMNTRDRKDKEWQAATPMQKISLIKAYGGDSLAPYIDNYITKIGDYEGMSMDMVLGKIAKIAEQDGKGQKLLEIYTDALSKGGNHIPEMDALLKDT